jgi:Domain of unknown function (DUF4386)
MGDPEASAARKEAVDVIFRTLNRYLGVPVGEHLGYMLTGLWSGLAGVAVIQSDVLHSAFGLIGLILALLFLIGSLEFVGIIRNPRLEVCRQLVPIAYIGWSAWLFALGLALLITA